MTIGEKIKYFRTRICITQAKFAEYLGISSFTLSGFENNISLKTEGDFMGLMIMLIKTKIVLLRVSDEMSIRMTDD